MKDRTWVQICEGQDFPGMAMKDRTCVRIYDGQDLGAKERKT